MKIPTLRVVFDRKNVASQTKKGLVQLEILYNGKRKWISTGVKLFSGQWRDKTHVCLRDDAVQLNEQIDTVKSTVQEFINASLKKGEEFDFDKLDNFLISCQKSDNSFLDFVESRINERVMANGTKKQHKSMLNTLFEYGKIVYFSDLTPQNILLFDEWLKKRVHEQTTVYSYHKRLKVYIKEAIIFGLLDDTPYQGITIHRGNAYGKRKYLSMDEVVKLRDTEIDNPSLERVRDCFLFQCYTGLSYADLAKFDFSSTIIEEGKVCIRDVRVKTDTDYYVVLMKPAVEILKKYEYKLPIISNQNYNIMLKPLGALCGIKTKITSHVGRHTFATTIALSSGVRIEVLSRMLGHMDIKTTQIYAKILQKDVAESFDQIEQKINSSFYSRKIRSQK